MVPAHGAERKLQVGLAEPESAGYNHASLGLVAQLVEQRIENPCVGGSIPPQATKNSNKKPSQTTGLFVFPGPALKALPLKQEAGTHQTQWITPSVMPLDLVRCQAALHST